MKNKKFKRLNSFLRRLNKAPKLICPICDFKGEFLSLPNDFLENYRRYGLVYSLSDFETLNIKNYSCSNCGASDRDRLIALFFMKQFKANNNENLSLLDFAPSSSLYKLLSNFNFNYKSADLYMEHVDDKVDIREMQLYKDSSFDVFICSHILEHIDDDIKAMKELYRITKNGGMGLCLVPIPLSLDVSVEDEKYLNSIAERWKYFGQDDHVRMYSKNDFVNRLSKVGFKVEQLGYNYFGQEVFKKHGIDLKSILYLVRK